MRPAPRTVLTALRLLLGATGLALSAGPVPASELSALVRSASGSPLPEAVVYAEPVRGAGPVRSPKEVLIEQIDKTFVPEISVVQTGTAINFPNRDSVRHHVYSFSPAKVFEIKLFSGVPARPVVFDRPGEVVIGCNIHDQMVAHILVVDTPHFTKTDKSGKASLAGLPPGEYSVRAWHPAAQQATQTVTIAAQGSRSLEFRLPPRQAGQPRR